MAKSDIPVDSQSLFIFRALCHLFMHDLECVMSVPKDDVVMSKALGIDFPGLTLIVNKGEGSGGVTTSFLATPFNYLSAMGWVMSTATITVGSGFGSFDGNLESPQLDTIAWTESEYQEYVQKGEQDKAEWLKELQMEANGKLKR